MGETRQEAIMRIGKLLDESVTLTGKDAGGNGRFTFSTYDPAAEERAAIVRWLRNFWDGCDDEDLKAAADAIEGGEHLKEQSK
jgi:hypothetical protein